MAEQWTDEQSSETTALYNQLMGLYKKAADEKLFAGPQLPYEQAKGILENLVKEQKSKSGLEVKTNTAYSSGVISRVLSDVPTQYTLAGALVGVLISML